MARHKSEFKPAQGLSGTGNGHDESGENRIDTGRRHGKSKGARRLPGFATNEGRTAQKTAGKRSKKRGEQMGKSCTWCGTVLMAVSSPSISSMRHALCEGCLVELQAALSTNGLSIEASKPPVELK